MQQDLRVGKIKWRNLVCAVFAAAVIGATLFGMSCIQNQESLLGKILCVTAFTVLSAVLVFSITFFLNAIRNIFAGTVLRLTENGLKLPKRDPIPYSEIKKAETDNKNTLHILLTDGETISFRQKTMNLPAITVAQALNNRLR